MLLEIINPSDPYTMRCDSPEIAAVAVSILGQGKYALREIGGDLKMPPFLFGGHDAWFLAKFGRSFEKCIEQAMEEKTALAACLNSVLVGNSDDREEFESSVAGMSERGLVVARELWQEKYATSLNDIGGTAYAYAEAILEN